MKWLKILKEMKKGMPVKHKKIYDLALVFICIGVLFLIGGSELIGGKKDKNIPKNIQEFESIPEIYKDIEKKISQVLSNIKGAGRVEILITYDRSIERVYAYETRSNHSEGGRDQVKESDKELKIAYREDSNGGRVPVLLKEVLPPAKGAIVIADGGNDPIVRENLSQAIQVLLKLSAHSVQVLPRKD
jgi:stage III sporulation protein AG